MAGDSDTGRCGRSWYRKRIGPGPKSLHTARPRSQGRVSGEGPAKWHRCLGNSLNILRKAENSVAAPVPTAPAMTSCSIAGLDCESSESRMRGTNPPGTWRGKNIGVTVESARSKITLRRSFPRKRESKFSRTDVDPRLRGGDDNGDFRLDGWTAGPCTLSGNSTRYPLPLSSLGRACLIRPRPATNPSPGSVG
jgi:hypothetical protein